MFSYTDDWFSGGHAIDGWGFGLTDRERREKPAADAVRRAWLAWDRQAPSNGHPHPAEPLPKASVVVCSYNGGRDAGGVPAVAAVAGLPRL